MLDKFEAAALEAIQKAMQAVTGSGKLETRILNAEYNMGEVCGISGNSGRHEHRAVCISCRSNSGRQRQGYKIH